jgi:hypothetical protein
MQSSVGGDLLRMLSIDTMLKPYAAGRSMALSRRDGVKTDLMADHNRVKNEAGGYGCYSLRSAAR